jgi:hypothetical protein
LFFYADESEDFDGGLWNNCGTASPLDFSVEYLGLPLADTDKPILEIHKLVGCQELEMRSLGEEMKRLLNAVKAMGMLLFSFLFDFPYLHAAIFFALKPSSELYLALTI